MPQGNVQGETGRQNQEGEVMPKRKERVHREWFRTVSLGNRKSCPECLAKLSPMESIWSWGEYQNAKWRTVKHFCRACYPSIQSWLRIHMNGCHCGFELVGYRGTKLPEWLNLDGKQCEIAPETAPSDVI